MRILPSLAALALADSTSFGAFDVPLIMLIQKRVRAAAVAVYLLALAVFYWAAGLALVFGARGLVDDATRLSHHPLFGWGEAVVGAGLIVGSLFLSQSKANAARRRRLEEGAPPSLFERLQQRLVGEKAGLGAVAAAAVGLGVLEIATMLPFLAAMTLILGRHWSFGHVAWVLAVYVAVMILPAAVLLGLRMVLGAKIEGRLARIHAWIESHSTVVLAWILRIAGAVLIWDGVHRLLGHHGSL